MERNCTSLSPRVNRPPPIPKPRAIEISKGDLDDIFETIVARYRWRETGPFPVRLSWDFPACGRGWADEIDVPHTSVHTHTDVDTRLVDVQERTSASGKASKDVESVGEMVGSDAWMVVEEREERTKPRVGKLTRIRR